MYFVGLLVSTYILNYEKISWEMKTFLNLTFIRFEKLGN